MDTLPAGWRLASTDDLFEFVTSGSRGWAQHYSDHGPAFIRIGNLDHGTIELDLTSVQRVQPPRGAEGERTRLRPNDILVSITAELGMVGLVPSELGEAYINQHVALARPATGSDPRFLAWFLASEYDGKRQLREMQRGATKVGLGLDDIRSVQVPLPPLDQQRRIVEKIEALTAKSRRAKEALDAIPPLLERFRKSVLAAAFRGDLTRDWRDQHPDVEPAVQLLARIRQERRARWEQAELEKLRAKGKPPKNDDWKQKYVEPEAVDTEGLPELPAGWCWASCEELTAPGRSIIYGIIKPGPDTPGGVPYVRVMEMKDGTIDLATLNRCAPERAALFSRATLRAGDILVSKDGTIGRVAIVPPELEGGNITQHVLRVSPTARVVNTFVARMIEAPASQAWMVGETKGVALQGVNVGDFRRLPIPLCPVQEQTALVRVLDRALASSAGVATALGASRRLAAGIDAAILAKAFRGELVEPTDGWSTHGGGSE
jgi:type I restriction enzyme S subunit